MSAPGTEGRIAAAAGVTIALHAAGLAVAATGMRPGTPLAPGPARMAWVAGAPLGWTLGWATWMLCALSLIVFYSLIAARLDEGAGEDGGGTRALIRIALALAVAGLAVDLLCDVIFMLVLPLIAQAGVAGAGQSGGAAATLLFVTVERIATAGGEVVANGLYSLGGLLLSRAMRGRAALRWAMPLGVGFFLGGAAMVGAGLAGSATAVAVATGPAIGLYCCWALVVARGLSCESTKTHLHAGRAA